MNHLELEPELHLRLVFPLMSVRLLQRHFQHQDARRLGRRLGRQAELDAQVEHRHRTAAQIDQPQHVRWRLRHAEHRLHVDDLEHGVHRHGEHLVADAERDELRLAPVLDERCGCHGGRSVALEVGVVGVAATRAEIEGEATRLDGRRRRTTRGGGGRTSRRTFGHGREAELAGHGRRLGRRPDAGTRRRSASRRLDVFDAEVGDGGLQLLGLGRQFLGSRRHLFRGTGILLDHLVELLDSLIDLVGADVLLATGGGDFLDEFREEIDRLAREPLNK